MNEIITDLDARQLADRLTALELHSTSELARLEQERDEAREKAERYRREANKFMLQRDESQEKYATEATEHMLAVNKLCNERDEAQADCLEQARLLGMGSEREARLISERDDALSQIVQAECRAERFCQERDEARDAIVGWENKWKCAIDMAARAELERDEALKCAKEYYVEFIRNASSDNKVSKPNPLNPFYKY